MSESTAKLTKKQIKALEFKSKKSTKAAKELEEVKEESKKRSLEEETKKQAVAAAAAVNEDGEPVKKKRKTRRGKKGKGLLPNGQGPRFILFVGNLPYNITEAELKEHFKACGPDRIRIRSDKGIAFLEFSNEKNDIQKRIEVALRSHHTILSNRKINVELTAGGGGNSSNRLEKIKEKNEKLLVERRERIVKEEKAFKDKKSKQREAEANSEVAVTAGGIHPSRLALIDK